MKKSSVKNLTVASVIYKIIEINLTIIKEKLYKLLLNIIKNIKNEINNSSNHYNKICNIPNQVNY